MLMPGLRTALSLLNEYLAGIKADRSYNRLVQPYHPAVFDCFAEFLNRPKTL